MNLVILANLVLLVNQAILGILALLGILHFNILCLCWFFLCHQIIADVILFPTMCNIWGMTGSWDELKGPTWKCGSDYGQDNRQTNRISNCRLRPSENNHSGSYISIKMQQKATIDSQLNPSHATLCNLHNMSERTHVPRCPCFYVILVNN